MNLQQLEDFILKQSELLIKYKDSQVKPLLVAYKALLDQLESEVNKMYVDTNNQGEWDWKAISKANRIESLFTQLESELQKLAATTEKGLETAMTNIVKVDYALASYMLVRQLDGWMPIPPNIPKGALKEIMDIPWSGDHFSSRIWHNKDLLKTQLRRELTHAIVTGESIKKTTKRLQTTLETEAYKAERLVRTEMMAASNRAQKAHYKAFNAKYGKYDMIAGIKVLETLDRKTCAVCRAIDGKEFGPDDMDNVADVQHPNCRRRIVPLVSGFDESTAARAARDQDGKYYRTNAKTYAEYAEEQGIPVAYLPNEKEFEKYKAAFGKDWNVKTLNEFQELKYNKPNEWNKLQDNYYVKSRINSGAFGSTINPEKQAPHNELTRTEGRSYFFDGVNVQELFNKYAGTGIIERDNKGSRRNTEFVFTDEIIGVAVSEKGTKQTKAIKIHHSKNRTHIVPVKEDIL